MYNMHASRNNCKNRQTWVLGNQGECKYYLLSLFSILPTAWLYAFSYPKTLLLTWTTDHKQIQSMEMQIVNMAGGQEKLLQKEMKSQRCSQCNYSSKRLANLKRHTLVHSVIPPLDILVPSRCTREHIPAKNCSVVTYVIILARAD